MKQFYNLFLFFYALLYSSISFAYFHDPQTETVVIMRHAEKPDFGLGQLSCQGLNRSLFLPRVLYKKFGRPDYIFAPDPIGKVFDWLGFYNYVRPLTTIEPTAIQLNMPVYTQHIYTDVKGIVNELLAPKYHDATIFLTWEHFHAYLIAREFVKILGGNPNIIPFWFFNDFDSLYVLNVDWRRTPPAIHFIHDKQNLDDNGKVCPGSASLTLENELMHLDSNFTKTQQFIFIPEAEYYTEENGQLNCQGLNRAIALTAKLNTIFGKVDEFIAADPIDLVYDQFGKGYFYQRAVMTIQPATIYAGKPINTPAGYKAIAPMVQFLMDKKFLKKTLAISWKREELLILAKSIYQLTGGNPDEIPNTTPDPDLIYLITVNRTIHTTKASFRLVAENLNNQSQVCPISIDQSQYSFMMHLLKSYITKNTNLDYDKIFHPFSSLSFHSLEKKEH